VNACARCGQENPDGFRFCGACGAALGLDFAQAREVRKTVTIVFCDVTGSTVLGERLDPESLRRVMARTSTRCGRWWSGTAAPSRSSSATP
jgi:hypothetical protein